MINAKVLFISYDGLTDPLGQSQILPYLKGLSANGYNITILSCEKPSAFAQEAKIITTICAENNLKWEYVFYHKKPPILSTVWDINNLEKKAKQLQKKHAFDIVHCRSIMTAMIGYTLQKKWRIKLIFDIRGFWADERVEGNLWNLSNPIYKLVYKYFKQKEKLLFSNADAIVSLTENAKQYIEENFKTKNNISVIPCCADLNHFNPENIHNKAVDDLRTTLGIRKNDYVLTYLGSLGSRYMLREMLLFFKQLKGLQSSAKFLFISNSDTAEIENICAIEGLDFEDIIITSTDYKNVPKHIALGDASIFFIVSSLSGKAVSPTKQAEIMSMGIPMVTNTGLGDTDRLIVKTSTGIVVSDFTAESLHKAAKGLLNHPVDRENFRVSARKYFSLESGVEKYNRLYQALLT